MTLLSARFYWSPNSYLVFIMVLFNRAFDAHTNVVLHCVINETSRMVQWLALSPHNNKPLGLNPLVAGSLLWGVLHMSVWVLFRFLETTINQGFHKQTKLDQITQERLCGYKHTHTYTHRGIISRNGYSWVTRDRWWQSGTWAREEVQVRARH